MGGCFYSGECGGRIGSCRDQGNYLYIQSVYCGDYRFHLRDLRSRCTTVWNGEEHEVKENSIYIRGIAWRHLPGDRAWGILFTNSILLLLDTPENIFGTAKEYIQILFAGIPFLAVYNIYSAVLRGMGDSKAPFLSVLVCSGVNVILDLIFVVALRYGAAGAAAATVISQSVMTIFIVAYAVKRYRHLRFRLNGKTIEKTIIARGARFSLPPAVQAGTSSVGNLLLQRFMNGFGSRPWQRLQLLTG